MNIKKILLITVSIIVTIFLGLYVLFSQPQMEFDSLLWKNGDMATRGSMVKDLESRQILIGKSREEVRNILGSPGQEKPDYWSYDVDIGVKWGSSPWIYFFYISFDENIDSVDDVWHTD